jgi:hypothetical protein
MPFGTSAMNYAKSAIGMAGKGFHKGAGYMGGNYTAMSAATGAVGGGLYGATAGRDYGQSRLGGAFTGALGGAALGAGGYRYGYAASSTNRGVGLGMKIARNTKQSGPARRAGLAYAAKSAGQAGFRAMKADAARAHARIATGLNGNKAYNSIKGLFSKN